MIGDGFDMHIPKGYIYFAMAFSVMVEMLNLRLRRHGAPVKLHNPYGEVPDEGSRRKKLKIKGTVQYKPRS